MWGWYSICTRCRFLDLEKHSKARSPNPQVRGGPMPPAGTAPPRIFRKIRPTSGGSFSANIWFQRKFRHVSKSSRPNSFISGEFFSHPPPIIISKTLLPFSEILKFQENELQPRHRPTSLDPGIWGSSLLSLSHGAPPESV